jgi:hypothetical protein
VEFGRTVIRFQKLLLQCRWFTFHDVGMYKRRLNIVVCSLDTKMFKVEVTSMNNELNRVISHPALGLRNWFVDAVLKFAKIINNAIEIQRKIDSHGITTTTKSNKYGVQYKECWWSRDDTKCGPDTCVCASINWNRHNISFLLNEIVLILESNESRSRSASDVSTDL